jgi:alpha-beta hydrolase superfamily lysophospholipase
MNEREITYPSSNGEHEISAVIWGESGGNKAILQISHGMCEYMERYRGFAKYLAEKGFIVCINDHAGHGKSVKDVPGWFGETGGHGHIVNDMHSLYGILRKEYAGLPYFLLGHSMGSFATRVYCAKYGGGLDGIIYSGTGEATGELSLAIFLCKLMIKYKRGKKPGMIFAKRLDKKHNKRFYPKACEAHKTKQWKGGSHWLSRDTAAVKGFSENPDSFIFTYGGYLDLFTMLREVSMKEWYEAVPKELPCLMFSGGDDPVGGFGKGVTGIYGKLLSAGLKDITLKLYPEGRHEMLNELNRAEVYEDIYNWMEAHRRR